MQQIIKKIIDNKTKINITLFYVAYTIMIFFWMFTNVKFVSTLNTYLIKISYIIVALSCLFGFSKRDLKNKKNIFLLGALICSLISWIITDESTLAVLILFIIAAKNIKFNEIVKYDFKLRSLFIIIVVLLYVLNLTNDYYMYREDGTIRSSMGFAHPNTFAIYIFLLCSEFLYLNYEKLKLRHYIIVVIISFLLDYFTDSRASVLSIILLLLVVIVSKVTSNKVIENKLVKNFMPYTFIFFTIISIILCFMYNPGNKVIKVIDSALTGRIRLANEFLEEEPISLFGKDLKLVGEQKAKEKGIEPRVLDNAFIKVILQYGIVNYILLAIMFYIAIAHALKEKNYAYSIVLTIFIIRGFTGNGTFSLHTNVFLLYISNVIYLENSVKMLDSIRGEDNE